MRRALLGLGISLVSIACFAQETESQTKETKEFSVNKIEDKRLVAESEPKENRIAAYGAGFLYEHIKPNDFYAAAMVQPVAFINGVALSARAGYNYKLDNSKTITPYLSVITVQGHSCAGAGVKYEQSVTDLISVGANLESVTSLGKKVANTTVLELPVSFHMGEKRNYEIEAKSFVGLDTTAKKSKSFNGFSLGFGYRF